MRAWLCGGRSPPRVKVGHIPHSGRNTFVAQFQLTQIDESLSMGAKWEDTAYPEGGQARAATMVIRGGGQSIGLDRSMITSHHHLERSGQLRRSSQGNSRARHT